MQLFFLLSAVLSGHFCSNFCVFEPFYANLSQLEDVGQCFMYGLASVLGRSTNRVVSLLSFLLPEKEQGYPDVKILEEMQK